MEGEIIISGTKSKWEVQFTKIISASGYFMSPFRSHTIKFLSRSGWVTVISQSSCSPPQGGAFVAPPRITTWDWAAFKTNILSQPSLFFETSDHSFSGLTQAYSSPLLFDSTCKTSKTVSDHHSRFVPATLEDRPDSGLPLLLMFLDILVWFSLTAHIFTVFP